ncbi:MAG: crotonase/enoyl-CoA hydratase family protein [Candidatus Obscuribacterales bacterium]|nr:crotonase/enoyl-CoA hydratase family protein [Candidatus Obscuribacterales bacterium]
MAPEATTEVTSEQSTLETVFKSLKVECSNHIAEVVLLGPGPGNAMGPEFWQEFPVAISELSRDKSVRAIIIKGSGKHFCSGLDLAKMMPVLAKSGKMLGEERSELLRLIVSMQDAISSVENCAKPVIASIHGACIGAGVDLIAACDIRICSSDARFSVREVKVAIVADLGSLQRLPHIIGEGRTRELAFTGKDIQADEAMRIGLVTHVFNDIESLDTGARKLAVEIAENPPLVVAGVKKILNESRDQSVAAGLQNVAVWNSAFLHSAELEEAITAFMQKRQAKF